MFGQQQPPTFSFSTPQTQKNNSFGYNNPQQSSTNTFGSSFQQTPQQTASTFGSSFQQQQVTFGSSFQQPVPQQTFGKQQPSIFDSNAQTSSLFSAQTSQPAAQQPSSFFGAPQTSIIPSTAMFSSQVKPSNQSFKFQQSVPSVASQQLPSVLPELENIALAYTPTSPLCKFRHPFYNIVPPEDVQKYQKPPYIPDGLWEDAIKHLPPNLNAVPVFASCIEDLQKRIGLQSKTVSEQIKNLTEIEEELEKISVNESVQIHYQSIEGFESFTIIKGSFTGFNSNISFRREITVIVYTS
jgi:nuclear pore complex protein Nup54